MFTKYYTIRNPYTKQEERRRRLKQMSKRSLAKIKNGALFCTVALSFMLVSAEALTIVNRHQTMLLEGEILAGPAIEENEPISSEQQPVVYAKIPSNDKLTSEPVEEQVPLLVSPVEKEENDRAATTTIEESLTSSPSEPSTETEIEQAIWFNPSVPLDEECQLAIFELCEENSEYIEAGLILGVIEYESNFNPNALNPKSGCYGYMQLNPKYFPSQLSPVDNIKEGVKYLVSLIQRYKGDIPAALRAYNYGHDDGNRHYSNVVLDYARDNWGYTK